MKVIIVEAKRIVREALCRLLQDFPVVQAVIEAGDGPEAVRLTRDLRPDAVVFDADLLRGLAENLIKQLFAAHEDTRVIALFSRTDGRLAARLLKGGVSGLVLKQNGFAELRGALETVADDQVYLSAELAGLEDDEDENSSENHKPIPVASLSPRESEVLQHLADGHSSKEIALKLGLSLKTIETHRRHIAAKLGIQSVAALTKYALREGLTSLD